MITEVAHSRRTESAAELATEKQKRVAVYLLLSLRKTQR